MFWDTIQATKRMTPAGAKSRSSCAPPKGSRPSAFTTKPATTLPATSLICKFAFCSSILSCIREADCPHAQTLSAVALLSLAFALLRSARLRPGQSSRAANSAARSSRPDRDQQGGSIKVDVSLVVLHTTVLDDRGKFVDGLKEENFRVFEDKAEQKLSVFKREDVPVSMGLVIDNSGSMRDKRPRVNEAALTLVQASNPQDEAFVVNFNDDYYLDLDKDFTSSIPELKEALERIDARGSTALYDAVIGSTRSFEKGPQGQKGFAGGHRRRRQCQPQLAGKDLARNSEVQRRHLHHRPLQRRRQEEQARRPCAR